MYSFKWLLYSLIICLGFSFALAHHPSPIHLLHNETSDSSQTKEVRKGETRVSGQGEFRFRVLYTRSHLPEPAIAVLKSAHGGFAVDRRSGRGQTYFALPGAGIIEISGDLASTTLLETDENMQKLNMHNATIWYDQSGTPFLSFPANNAAAIFTTTIQGKLVHTLAAPSSGEQFNQTVVTNYFLANGKFSPTDVEYLSGLFYITTGYSSLDYVLTAKVTNTAPFQVTWNDLAFGGKGDKPGQFGTGHGITISSEKKQIDVADRSKGEIDQFTPYGHYETTWKLPIGSYPCDIDYSGDVAIAGCLHGPDRSKGAPIYLFENRKMVSTVMIKEELGLENFQHIHNAVLRKIGQRYYIIAQAWNPGDFAILEQIP